MFTEVFAKGDLPRFGRILVQVHPFHVGKMVLDGVAPGSLTLEQSFYQQGVAYDDSLRRFIADCLHQSDCPLTGTVANGIARIQKFLNDLDAKPIPAGPGRVLAEGLATPGIYYALYSGRDGWPGLRSSLTSAFAGDGSGLIGNVDAVYGRQPDGTYVGNLFPAFYPSPAPTPQNSADHHTSPPSPASGRRPRPSSERAMPGRCCRAGTGHPSAPASPPSPSSTPPARRRSCSWRPPTTPRPPTRVAWRSPRNSTTPHCSPTTATDTRPTAADPPASTPQSTPTSSKEPRHHTELGAPPTH